MYQEILQKLKEHFGENIECEFIDERNDGRHFYLRIVSSHFASKSRIERSQLVYSILNDYIKKDHIHALRMKLYTPEELEKSG